MKFIWTPYEFHMKCNKFYSCEIHKKFIWTSHGVRMNFLWISYEIKSNLFIWIYMHFVWNSCELHIEELMKLIWYTHAIQTSLCEALNSATYEIHMNFEWFELHLNFIWTSWEFHDRHNRGSYVLHMNMVSDILALYFIWMSFQVHRTIGYLYNRVRYM